MWKYLYSRVDEIGKFVITRTIVFGIICLILKINISILSVIGFLLGFKTSTYCWEYSIKRRK